MGSPPDEIVAAAVEVARRSPCSKSKRGAVVYEAASGVVVASGFNGPPRPMFCDGSAECRKDCGKVCMHAEERAIVTVNKDEWQRFGATGMNLQHLDLVHVKVVAGELVPGGGPSCWQCSRTVLDEQLGGVWLFERDPLAPECPGPDCMMCNGESCNICAASYGGEACDHAVDERHRDEPEQPPAIWRRYTAEEFHRTTLANAKGGRLYAPR